MPHGNPKSLLLSPHLDQDEVVAILAPYGFREVKKADTNIQLMAEDPRARQMLSEIIEELLRCLGLCPDPDQALNYFERFFSATYSKVHLFTYLKASPYTLWLLAKLFGSSPFLSEILIRNPTYLYWIAEPNILEASRPKSSLSRDAAAALRSMRTKERKFQTLCLFKRKELLRIGSRDLLKKSSVQDTTRELTALAEVIIQKTYEICSSELRKKYGIPLRRSSSVMSGRARFAILGMGKLGGEELNFSSDIDILYVHDSSGGMTSGGRLRHSNTKISNTEYFKRLSQDITSALSSMTDQGYLYRVDLRLRPEGRSGPIVHPTEAYMQYYGSRGETWEHMALSKAWPVAGDEKLGRDLRRKLMQLIYPKAFSEKYLMDIRSMKERIDRKLILRGETELNVKLGTGGIREIEFLVQSIQVFFGSRITKIRERNTLRALKKLFDQKILDENTYCQLTEAYIFLRTVEHRLQMVHEFQTHCLPADPHELRLCALRLDYRDRNGMTASDLLLRDYRRHTAQVHSHFRDLFYTSEHSALLRAALKQSRQTASKRLR